MADTHNVEVKALPFEVDVPITWWIDAVLANCLAALGMDEEPGVTWSTQYRQFGAKLYATISVERNGQVIFSFHLSDIGPVLDRSIGRQLRKALGDQGDAPSLKAILLDPTAPQVDRAIAAAALGVLAARG